MSCIINWFAGKVVPTEITKKIRMRVLMSEQDQFKNQPMQYIRVRNHKFAKALDKVNLKLLPFGNSVKREEQI